MAAAQEGSEALARSIWADASADFTFPYDVDGNPTQATCNWNKFDACVQHPAFRGGLPQAYNACEKSMLKAFEDPRLTAEVEPYLLFYENPPSGCTSLVSASGEIYPDSKAVATARSDFAERTTESTPTPDLPDSSNGTMMQNYYVEGTVLSLLGSLAMFFLSGF